MKKIIVLIIALTKRCLGVKEDKQQENVEQKMSALVEAMKDEWFPAEEEGAWKEWVDYKKRETRDLISMLVSDVKDGFKRRALFLLIVPSADFNPIYWKEEIGKFYCGYDFVKTLTPDLLSYAVDLIAEFSAILKPLHCDRPQNFVDGGGGFRVYMSIPDKYHTALRFYNNCILTMIVKLPEEQGEKLFPFFSLNDISTFWNMDEASGYNPFRQLLCIKELDERWKKAADLAMRNIIQDEVTGKTEPREDHEDALRCYASIIQMQLYGELTYSVKLFGEQVQFLMDNRNPNVHLIDSWHIIKMFKLLSDDFYKELRHQTARFVVLENITEFSNFSVYNEESRQAAEQMLAEFGDDQELAEKVLELIAEGERRQTANAAYQAEEKKTEEGILAAMK
jgi:hypothetical protein